MFLKIILGLRFSYNNTFLIINWLQISAIQRKLFGHISKCSYNDICTDNS